MRSQGIEVLRYGGFEIEEDTHQVLERIEKMLVQRCKAPHPQPFSPGVPGEKGARAWTDLSRVRLYGGVDALERGRC